MQYLIAKLVVCNRSGHVFRKLPLECLYYIVFNNFLVKVLVSMTQPGGKLVLSLSLVITKLKCCNLINSAKDSMCTDSLLRVSILKLLESCM